MAAIAAGGFLLMRQSFTVWRSELAEAQAAATASREERARQAQEVEEADRRAASIPAVPQPARGFDPLARRAGGFSPLAPTAGRPAETEDAVPTNPEFGDLPDTLGVETVFFQCTWCH